MTIGETAANQMLIQFNKNTARIKENRNVHGSTDMKCIIVHTSPARCSSSHAIYLSTPPSTHAPTQHTHQCNINLQNSSLYTC